MSIHAWIYVEYCLFGSLDDEKLLRYGSRNFQNGKEEGGGVDAGGLG